ncbi:MAG: YggW family oxidoreductase [Gammaproteobacteria bacterium RIFCSPHIGHO2_12_FULL_43_28]|nr:MAG: YggW family oxidoreductase [Gammaproteobacteria bacterium RIFCSPHIGHO2_12_FULL_43_28]
MMPTNLPPLSLYIHLPWCIRKCPYCDFNSHEKKGELPEKAYVDALMDDLDQQLPRIHDRPLKSIFFGGGTPSLFSAEAIAAILTGVKNRIAFDERIEITLEANPGAIEQNRFSGFRDAGVNRLSLGIQSFQDEKLKILGRIHHGKEAECAIEIAKGAGFTNFNVDLMFGLPQQTIEDALFDLTTALSFQPTHLSWYQLTIEPNTFFHHQPPLLPADDAIWDIQLAGQKLLQQHHFKQYEVSAYAKENKYCKHNINYWEFGDYLGIGAGAYSKMTDQDGNITRFSQVKHPKAYLDAATRNKINYQTIAKDDRIFEFMLNALRLTDGVNAALFTERTGVALTEIAPCIEKAKQQGLLVDDTEKLCASQKGAPFLNNLIAMFLPPP